MAKQKAKKHAHKAGESAPAAPRHKKDNTLLWVVGAIILVIVIVLLIRSAKETQIPSAPPSTIPPKETTTPPKTEPKLSGMEVMDYCSIGAAIGAKPQFCEKTADGVSVMITHLGADTLEGLKYYVLDENKEILGEGTVKGPIAGQSEGLFSIPVSQLGAESIELRTIATVDGALKECKNQRTFQSLNRCI